MKTLYYNTKTDAFEYLTRTTTTYKIKLTEAILRDHIRGTYGPKELTGQYYSTVNGIDFFWDDLSLFLVDGTTGIRVYHPYYPDIISFCD